MIHFDFIVTDEEAEAILSTISAAINQCQERADFGKFRFREANLKHKQFLEELKKKMTNSKVQNG